MGHLHLRQLIAPTLLLFVLVVTYYSYSEGIKGPFIFDDIPNLSPLGKYPDLSAWDNFWLFLLEADSGPTGRPISLISFYLNDIAWPSQPSGFITTNIFIHLLNGVLVFWFSYKLAEALKLQKQKTYYFAFFAFALWILHPMHTTTVLYVIQRMTELSATFTLAGLLFYLYGREQLENNFKKGILKLILGVGGSLVLSITSKENGILLVGYILAIEFFLLRPMKIPPPRHFTWWLRLMVILPFTYIIFYLAQSVWQTAGVFNTRDFNLIERLLTESRILFDYIHHILLPSSGDSTLFHDDYIISRGILSPWTTLPAVLGIISLLISTFFLRTRQPLLAFSLAWFFVGHLLESTVIGLELYFEHRNYLPMLGFFIAITWYAINATQKLRVPIISSGILILGIFIFSITQKASLWGNPKELAAIWYEHHPNSARVQEAYSILVGPITTKTDHIEHQKNNKQFSYMVLLDLQRSCLEGKATNKDLKRVLNLLNNISIQPSTTNALRDFMETWNTGACKQISQEQLISFLEQSTSIENIKKSRLYLHMTYFWLYTLHFNNRDLDKVMDSLDMAYKTQPSIDLLILQAKQLFSAGLYHEAMARLNDTKALENNLKSKIILKIRSKELETLKQKISVTIENKKSIISAIRKPPISSENTE